MYCNVGFSTVSIVKVHLLVTLERLRYQNIILPLGKKKRVHIIHSVFSLKHI